MNIVVTNNYLNSGIVISPSPLRVHCCTNFPLNLKIFVTNISNAIVVLNGNVLCKTYKSQLLLLAFILLNFVTAERPTGGVHVLDASHYICSHFWGVPRCHHVAETEEVDCSLTNVLRQDTTVNSSLQKS